MCCPKQPQHHLTKFLQARCLQELIQKEILSTIQYKLQGLLDYLPGPNLLTIVPCISPKICLSQAQAAWRTQGLRETGSNPGCWVMQVVTPTCWHLCQTYKGHVYVHSNIIKNSWVKLLFILFYFFTFGVSLQQIFSAGDSEVQCPEAHLSHNEISLSIEKSPYYTMFYLQTILFEVFASLYNNLHFVLAIMLIYHSDTAPIRPCGASPAAAAAASSSAEV